MTVTTTTPSQPISPEAYAQARLDDQAAGFSRAIVRLRKQYSRSRITAEEKLTETCRIISEAFGDDPRTDRRYFTPADVLFWFSRAVELDAEAFAAAQESGEEYIPVDVPVVGEGAAAGLFTRDTIPNATIREHFERLQERGELSTSKLASAIGATKVQDGNTVGDATYVERMLGIAPSGPETDKDGRRYRSLRLFVTYDQAVALVDALPGLDYHDVGV